jgi:hypothetical protein
LEHPPPAPPGRVADLLEERMWIAMSSNTRGSDLGDGRNAYWLGPRFDGALAMPGSPVPGDASVQATYYLPDGDRVAHVQVLSYNRRLDAVPCLGDDYQCANGLPVDVALLARRDTAGQTVLITAGADASIGAAMRRRIRAALQPVSATSPHPDLCPGLELPCDLVGVGAGLEPAAPPPPPTVEGPVYWLGPSFHGEPIVDNMALPGTTAYLYTLIDHHTSVRVVTVTPGRLGACIHSRYCSRSVYAGIRRTPAIATVRRGDRWVVLIQNGGEPLPAALVRRMVRAIQPA